MQKFRTNVRLFWKKSTIQQLLPSKIHQISFQIFALVFITGALVLIAVTGNQWIMVCGPFYNNVTEEFVVDEVVEGGMFHLSSLGLDSVICLKIGLAQAELTISYTYSILIGISVQSPNIFKICLFLIILATVCLLCNTILFVLVIFTPLVHVRSCLNVEKLGLFFSTISFLLLTSAIVHFTMYKERTDADADPATDLFKHMMNNFSTSYGISYFLAMTALVCNGLVCFLMLYIFRKNKLTMFTLKENSLKCKGRNFV